VKIPRFDLESRVLWVAIAAVVVALLRLAHLIHFSESGITGLLFFFAILLATFVVSGRYAAAGTALCFFCFELLCWMNPPAGNSTAAAVFHGLLLGFFGLGFAFYAFGAVRLIALQKAKPGTAQETGRGSPARPATELSGARLEGGQG